MPTWPRTILPTDATWPQFPGALAAVAQSGKTQLRATAQIGRVWSETYGPLQRSNQAVQAFLATVNNYWRNGTLFQIDHRGQRGIFGLGTGTPTVNGASQTGASVVTTGWTANQTNILRAGDVILLPGITVVYDVTADVNSGTAGAATIPINPPLYCLAVDERILTRDLRWVRAGDLAAGDELLAFDEHLDPVFRRRYWKPSTVLYAASEMADCVRVVLADGTSVVCTADHPWLSGSGGTDYQWRIAADLITRARCNSPARTVIRAMRPWAPQRSYEAGWLAGMFDGEGHLKLASRGFGLAVTQNRGPVLDAFVERMRTAGFDARPKRANSETAHVYVCGGLAEIARCLGELRPERLLRKWQADAALAGRRVTGEQVGVVAVEPVGRREIQSIQTSTATYVGEGFLMHNTGTSPTNGGAITRNNVAGNVTYRARIADVQMPKAGPNEFYQMMTVTFVEVP